MVTAAHDVADPSTDSNPFVVHEAKEPMPPSDGEATVIAWQPITPGGVAKFAKASFANVILVELVVGALATAAVFWFLYTIWFPGIREAIRHLPRQGIIRNGALEWPNPSPVALLENRFLGMVVDVAEPPALTAASDIRVQFRKDQLSICSLFGSLAYPYPKQYIVELNRPEAEPWWGAWQPILLGFVIVGLPLLLLGAWAALATVYAPVAWLIAFYADRELTLGGSWRLASAALLPGTIVLSAALIAYGSSTIDLVQLLVVAGLHFVVGWVYLVVSVYAAPGLGEITPTKKRNPFAAEPAPDAGN